MDENKFSLRDPNTQSQSDKVYRASIGKYFESSAGGVLDKLENFTRFVPRQNLAMFLAKNFIFNHILNIHGSIVECGVFMGGGLFTWAQLSAIYEPINHNRKIIGFDSFEGFPSLDNKDLSELENSELAHKKLGGYCFEADAELRKGIDLFDLNRSVGHISKINLVKGNATKTIPEYVEKNPHTVVSLLYLDFDLYEPTVAALKSFLPRMPMGAILAFDELNQAQWPGETIAVLEEVGLQSLAIRRFTYTPSLSYAILD